MTDKLITAPFLAVTFSNFCLFLIVTTWSLLPLFVVDLGGNTLDVGIVMGSLGVTSLGSLPLLAPLIDRYGRKSFILWGILAAGVSNAGFLAFHEYSMLMVPLRLVQGVAFAACFNACAAAVVDCIPEKRRAEGIGIFGISGSLATAIGPYLGEACIINLGYRAFFLLLVGFGALGFLAALIVKESAPKPANEQLLGFFATALRGSYLPMMGMAVTFGAGFAAMVNFFPLLAKTLGIRVGVFFLSYGLALLLVRVFLGRLADTVDRDRLILACLLGFAGMLAAAGLVDHLYQSAFVGIMFGVAQGFSYPAMMARMVDRSVLGNRAVVVALYTGSFGVGIHASSLAWGALAQFGGLPFMFLVAAILMGSVAAVSLYSLLIAHVESRRQHDAVPSSGPRGLPRG
jgi:MFS family permease